MKTKFLIGSLVVLNVALLGLLLARDRYVAPVGAESQLEPDAAPAPVNPQPAYPSNALALSPPRPALEESPAAVEVLEEEPVAPRAVPARQPKPEPRAPARVAATEPRHEPRPEPVRRVSYEPDTPVTTADYEPSPVRVEADVRPEPPARPFRPRPTLVELPAGIPIAVRLVHGLNSRDLEPGSAFEAELADDLLTDGKLVARAGTPVEGIVQDVQQSGRVQGVESFTLALTSLEPAPGRFIELSTSAATFSARESHKKDAATIGGAAALGAIIGAIAKGGKGAATGAAAGAAAGTGVVVATKGESVKIEANTRLSFTLEESVRAPELREDGDDVPEHEDRAEEPNPNVAWGDR